MKSIFLENLTKAVTDFDPTAAETWANKALEEEIDPIEAMDALTRGIRQVGDEFERGDAYLPELVGAASAMQAAMPVLQNRIKASGAKQDSAGVIVIGTVFGDIHTIGKTMVSTLCAAEGFEVHDLGVNVTAKGFVEGIQEHNGDILAMSALMTMTAPHIREVIHMLEEQGIRDKVKVMVGGAGVTESFANDVGTDGYEPTAPGAAKLARALLGN